MAGIPGRSAERRVLTMVQQCRARTTMSARWTLAWRCVGTDDLDGLAWRCVGWTDWLGVVLGFRLIDSTSLYKLERRVDSYRELIV